MESSPTSGSWIVTPGPLEGRGAGHATRHAPTKSSSQLKTAAPPITVSTATTMISTNPNMLAQAGTRLSPAASGAAYGAAIRSASRLPVDPRLHVLVEWHDHDPLQSPARPIAGLGQQQDPGRIGLADNTA